MLYLNPLSPEKAEEKEGPEGVLSLSVCVDTELCNWECWGQRKGSQKPENFFPPLRENFTKEASKRLNIRYGLQSQQKRKVQPLWTFFVLFWLVIGFSPFPYTFHNFFILVSFYTHSLPTYFFPTNLFTFIFISFSSFFFSSKVNFGTSIYLFPTCLFNCFSSWNNFVWLDC